jgi:hypothetical protein
MRMMNVSFFKDSDACIHTQLSVNITGCFSDRPPEALDENYKEKRIQEYKKLLIQLRTSTKDKLKNWQIYVGSNKDKLPYHIYFNHTMPKHNIRIALITSENNENIA